MNGSTILSRELGSAIDKINSSTSTSQLDSLIEQLRSVEEIFISRAEGEPAVITEIKRRIAEAMFLASIAKRSSFRLCKGLFRKLRELGYSNSERELTFCIIFARYCLKCSQFSEGIQLLEPFENEWKQKDQESVFEYSKQDMTMIRDLLQELRTR